MTAGEAERNAFFDGRWARIEAEAEQARECEPGRQDCDAVLAVISEARHSRIRLLEEQRATARIDGSCATARLFRTSRPPVA